MIFFKVLEICDIFLEFAAAWYFFIAYRNEKKVRFTNDQCPGSSAAEHVATQGMHTSVDKWDDNAVVSTPLCDRKQHLQETPKRYCCCYHTAKSHLSVSVSD